MGKTKEERAAAGAERKKERERLLAKFPNARLANCENDDFGVVVALDCANEGELRIMHRGQWWQPIRGLEGWTEMTISLRHPIPLANFIAALIARYNALIEELNAQAEKCEMLEAKKMKPSPQPGRSEG